MVLSLAATVRVYWLGAKLAVTVKFIPANIGRLGITSPMGLSMMVSVAPAMFRAQYAKW